jgi:hypothetical protein
MTISRTPYFGLGVVIAPKSKMFAGHIIINFLVWEVNIKIGSDLDELA